MHLASEVFLNHAPAVFLYYAGVVCCAQLLDQVMPQRQVRGFHAIGNP